MSIEFTFQRGFLSTSLDKDIALSFANPNNYESDNPDIISVLLKIELKHRRNFFIYDDGFTAF